jgi:hypothetical protein
MMVMCDRRTAQKFCLIFLRFYSVGFIAFLSKQQSECPENLGLLIVTNAAVEELRLEQPILHEHREGLMKYK